MIGRRYLSIAVGVLLVAVLLVQPATAASALDPDPDQACQQTDGEVLIGILPGDDEPTSDQVLTGETSLYAGTTLQLALCENGDLKHTRGTEWEIEETDGLDVRNGTDATVTVRVTGELDRVNVPSLVLGKEELDGVVIVVPTTQSAESDLVEGSVTFQSERAAENYSERAYLDAIDEQTSTASRLNESAAMLGSDGMNSDVVIDEIIPTIEDQRAAVATEERRIEGQLHDAAWESNSRSAIEAREAARDQRVTADAQTKAALENYLEELEAAERAAILTVASNFGIAALLGLVFGLLPGWKLTADRLAAIRYDRQVNSNISYGPQTLARAGGLALISLLVTVVAIAAMGGLEIIGGLL